MNNLSPSTHTLRNRSIIGLCIIVSFILIYQFIFHTLIADQTANSRVINLAGRQRMLSQQLSKDVVILQYASDPTIRTIHQAELTGTVEQWQQSHEGLQQGDFALSLPE